MAKILLVDDNPQNIELLSLRLAAAGHNTIEARNGEEALTMVTDELPDLMILDLQMPKLDGLQVLQQLQADCNDIPVIVISAFATVERAVEAMKAGALDFITKPFDPTHLELVVTRALERTTLANQNRFLTEELNARYHFVLGVSSVMSGVYEGMVKAGANETPVLVQGEGGIGKEVVARFIHRESARKEAPFVAIRCGALDANGQQQVLFGSEDDRGRIELARGGVLFLEEVSKLASPVQAQIVTLINEHGYCHTGSDAMLPSDVRVIASSSVDLSNCVAEGTVSQELADLLAQQTIRIPPLRDRPEDIAELANYFVERSAAEQGRKLSGVSTDAMQRLSSYHWPGNVRELANILERAVSIGRSDKVETADLGIAVREALASAAGSAPGAGTGNFDEQMTAAKRQIVLDALKRAEGSTAAASDLLHLSREQLEEMVLALNIRK